MHNLCYTSHKRPNPLILVSSGIAGGTVGMMTRRGKSRIAPTMKCYYWRQPGHVKASCEVRKYRIENYGDGKDEENMGDSGKHKALSARVARVAF